MNAMAEDAFAPATACAHSSSQAMLVVARGVEGVGGSIIGAVSLLMIVVLFRFMFLHYTIVCEWWMKTAVPRIP